VRRELARFALIDVFYRFTKTSPDGSIQSFPPNLPGPDRVDRNFRSIFPFLPMP
jgi:hypothetical protein